MSSITPEQAESLSHKVFATVMPDPSDKISRVEVYIYSPNNSKKTAVAQWVKSELNYHQFRKKVMELVASPKVEYAQALYKDMGNKTVEQFTIKNPDSIIPKRPKRRLYGFK